MSQNLDLTLMLADYHRTRPLLNGEVAAKGINLQPRRAETGEACMRPVYEEFDIAEMSLSWYMMARCRNEPVIALPIFPLRMQIHPYIFCSPASGIEKPEELKGKKIGMDEYRLTVGLWARGILQEHYGVRPEECEWFTSDPERAGYQPPENIKITVVDEPTEALLLRGEIDALIPPNIVPSFRAKDPRIRRVFKDIRSTVKEYYQKSKIFPITHTLVVRQSLFDEHPWLVSSILNAFTEAEERCRKSYEYAKRSAFPSAVLILEEEEERFGTNPWGHGLTPENQVVLEKFVQYANEQGYIPNRPPLSDLFAPVGN
jgi:4,5-dihydroxyphthalate decarboxylase